MNEVKTITLQLDIELHKKLKHLAIEKGLTLKDLLLDVIKNNAK